MSFQLFTALSLVTVMLISGMLGMRASPQILDSTIKILPTITPAVTQIIPTKKTVNYVVQPTTDPDPPVHCKISQECGGGTKPLRQSECRISTCCGFPGGHYDRLRSKQAQSHFY